MKRYKIIDGKVCVSTKSPVSSDRDYTPIGPDDIKSWTAMVNQSNSTIGLVESITSFEQSLRDSPCIDATTGVGMASKEMFLEAQKARRSSFIYDEGDQIYSVLYQALVDSIPGLIVRIQSKLPENSPSKQCNTCGHQKRDHCSEFHEYGKFCIGSPDCKCKCFEWKE